MQWLSTLASQREYSATRLWHTTLQRRDVPAQILCADNHFWARSVCWPARGIRAYAHECLVLGVDGFEMSYNVFASCAQDTACLPFLDASDHEHTVCVPMETTPLERSDLSGPWYLGSDTSSISSYETAHQPTGSFRSAVDGFSSDESTGSPDYSPRSVLQYGRRIFDSSDSDYDLEAENTRFTVHVEDDVRQATFAAALWPLFRHNQNSHAHPTSEGSSWTSTIVTATSRGSSVCGSYPGDEDDDDAEDSSSSSISTRWRRV